MNHRLRNIGIVGSVLVVGLLAGDWIVSLALVVLFVGWKYLSREQGPPIAVAAFSNQWLQVTAGLLYFALTGRRVSEMDTSDYRPMVLIGLASVVVLFLAFYLGAGFRRLKRGGHAAQRPLPWSTNQIAVIYAATIASSGILQQLAWSISGLTQVILVFSRVRYMFLFFLVTRLIKPTLRWPWIVVILGAELMLGFTGFFADFREPLIIIAIAIVGAVNPKRVGTWVIIVSIGALAAGSAVVWTAVKPIIRQNYVASASTKERLNVVVSLTGSTFASGAGTWKRETDHFVSRIWSVYYPALALKRVPVVLPHTNGTILGGAIDNVLTPRMFFPGKPVLPSESDEVRVFSGVWVTGRETNTSYAFGYVGESYVDFGLPLMFLPIFGFGLLLGFAYRWLATHTKHDELRMGATLVIVWSTLGLYEASWVMLIGPAVTILIVLGGGAVLLDKMFGATAKERIGTIAPGSARSWVART